MQQNSMERSIEPQSTEVREFDRHPMPTVKLDCIQTLEAFDALEPDWQRVYDRDPQATVFSTWAWLRGNVQVQGDPLWILAAFIETSGDREFVGFLPLKLRSVGRGGLVLERRLEMLGNYDADYTSLLCLPEYEAIVIPAFADYVVSRRDWNSLTLMDVLDDRLDALVAAIQSADPRLALTVEQGNVSPFVCFDGDWEQYLMTTVKGTYRRKIRNALKKVEGDPALQVVMANEHNWEKQLAAFFKLHRTQWQIYKTDRDQAEYSQFYRWCFDRGLLRLAVLYQDSTPIAADLLFYDEKHRSLGVYGRTYDSDYANLAPGHLNLSWVIRDVVHEGLTMFDFLRGDESYKAIFGSQDRWTRHVTCLRSRRSQWLWKARSKAQTVRSKAQAVRAKLRRYTQTQNPGISNK